VFSRGIYKKIVFLCYFPVFLEKKKIKVLSKALTALTILCMLTVCAIIKQPKVYEDEEKVLYVEYPGFVRIEGGTFKMGSVRVWEDDSRPIHTVTVSSFYMGKYEVTQKEWFDVMGTTIESIAHARRIKLYGEGDNYPMYHVSWFHAIEYCNRRSIKEGLTPVYTDARRFNKKDTISCDWNANGYRLPTEAEWEYAAKGGNGSPGNYIYSGSDNLDEVAWHENNSGGGSRPVGTKAPNRLGLYDMSGNVWEWCWDWYNEDYYRNSPQTNPRGASSGIERVIRGSSWNRDAFVAPLATRLDFKPKDYSATIGFRLVRNSH